MNEIYNFLAPKVDTKRIAFLRIALGVMYLLHLSNWAGRVKEFFSDEGYYTSALVQSVFPNNWSVLYYVSSTFGAYAIFYAAVIAATLFTIGVFPRCMSALMFIFLVSFQDRAPYFQYGADSVLRHVLFYTTFIPSHHSFRLIGKNNDSKVQSVFLTLLQFQIALIYFFAAVPKLSSADWMSGSYVYSVLNYPNRSYLDYLWLWHVPQLVNLITYSVLALEFSFIFLVWMQPTRKIVVYCAMLFHMLVFFSYNVVYFSLVMTALLPIFLSNDEHSEFRKCLRSLFPSKNKPLEPAGERA